MRAVTSPSAPQKSLPTPKKKLSLDKLMAMQRDIVVLDRKIAHYQKQLDSDREAVVGTPETLVQDSGEVSLFPIYLGSVPPAKSSGALADMDASCTKMILAVEMCQAAASGEINTLKILLGSGGDVNCCDYDMRTPLHIAVERGFEDIVRLLLEYSANPRALDEDRKTPIMIALEKGHKTIHDMLTFVSVGNAIEPDSFLSGVMSNGDLSVGVSPNDDVDVQRVATFKEENLVVVMVGLPGRGKTYIAQHIQRYFLWNHYRCNIMTHQSLRKKATGTTASYPEHIPDAEERVAALLASEVSDYFASGGDVVIVDGTHSTPVRRQSIREALMVATGLPSKQIIFVEVYSNDMELIMSNVLRAKHATVNHSATFVEDYLENMRQHERVYRTLTSHSDAELSFVRIDNQTTYDVHRVEGWLQSRLAYMLHNLRHTPQALYLTRSGEYEDLVSGRIGGNSRLTKRGEAYSRALYEFMRTEMGATPFVVMSSCATRCTQTVRHFVAAAIKNSDHFQEPPAPAHLGPPPLSQRLSAESIASSCEDKVGSFASTIGADGVPLVPSTSSATSEPNCRVAYFPTLDDLNHGDCEGQLLSDIMATLPNTMASMHADRYNVAWPNGESIQQLFNGRLEPHIHEIQASTQPLLIVSHEPLVQGFYAYFVRDHEGKMIPPEEAHKIAIPKHSVIRIVHKIDKRVAEIVDLQPRVAEILQAAKRGTATPGKPSDVSDETLDAPMRGDTEVDDVAQWLHRGSNVWGE